MAEKHNPATIRRVELDPSRFVTKEEAQEEVADDDQEDSSVEDSEV